MKKILAIILTVFGLLVLPQAIHAESDVYIQDYRIDATVHENGDIYVKELFELIGDFRGYDRIIHYRNKDAMAFDGTVSSFEGSDLYNGSGIDLIKIKSISINEAISFDNVHNKGTTLHESKKGVDKTYEAHRDENSGYRYRIYNKSKSGGSIFYLEYRIKNMGILHNDVAEIGWNLFSNAQTDAIRHFELKIHLPNNQETLRAWAHGPLNGNIALTEKNLITVTIDDLEPRVPMDVRFVFDPILIANSTKKSNMEGLPSILKVEEGRANTANQKRQTDNMIYYVTCYGSVIWMAGLILIIIYTYFRYDREYQNSFKGKYFRDFPSEDSPSNIGYLFYKKIRSEDLSAMIMNLVDKKIITFEEVPEKKDEYRLTYVGTDLSTLRTSEQHLIKWLFHSKEGDTLLLSDFKKNAKKNYGSFILHYDIWKNACETEAKERQFFEKKSSWNVLAILYCFLCIPLSYCLIMYVNIPLVSIIMFISGILAIFYLSLFTRRTKEGNELYAKWRGLKNFLSDFGKFETKELPQIVLWNQYLVYAITFGCAEKLIKTMKVKISEMDPGLMNTNLYHDYYSMNSFLLFHHTINHTVNRAVSEARFSANSNNSSSGGFGGGFSSGGGSFGGGGGGGHF